MSTNTTVVVKSLEEDKNYAANLLSQLGSKSKVIRYLTAEGWTRGRIAKSLDIIYQFVRNVQVKQAKKPTMREATAADLGIES